MRVNGFSDSYFTTTYVNQILLRDYFYDKDHRLLKNYHKLRNKLKGRQYDHDCHLNY